MISKLTSDQKSFIEMMKESPELEEHGFHLLSEKANGPELFDFLKRERFFSVEKAPTPIKVEEGRYRIPYWTALDYLEKVAEHAGKNNDANLTKSLLEILHSQTENILANRVELSNYHTNRMFVRILALLPSAELKIEDLNLISTWLDDRFGGDTVSFEISRTLLKKFPPSGEQPEYAFHILEMLLKIKWRQDQFLNEEPQSALSEHYLEPFFENNLRTYVQIFPERTIRLLFSKLEELFSKGVNSEISWMVRPAIEEHEQNRKFKKLHNTIIEASRDAVLMWCDLDEVTAKDFLRKAFETSAEIVKRITIHAVDYRWEKLRSLYLHFLENGLFESGHVHETYHLLNQHFSNFTLEEMQGTLDKILSLPKVENLEDADRFLRFRQGKWLSAIYGKGSTVADKIFENIDERERGIIAKNHPDFNSYMSTRWGSGPSEYTTEDIISFAHNGTLIEKLNSFVETGGWDSPSQKSLVDSLTEAVKTSQDLFLTLSETFFTAKLPYQYGYLNGIYYILKTQQEVIDIEHLWIKVISFCEHLLEEKTFWEKQVEDDNFTPTNGWMQGLIPDLLRLGFDDNSFALPQTLLPRAKNILIQVFLNGEGATNLSEIPMDQAINTVKGRALESIIIHALKECRDVKKISESHRDIGRSFFTFIEKQFVTPEPHYELYTLLGAYISNLGFISPEWIQLNVSKIFDPNKEEYFRCALDGLIFAPSTAYVYNLLKSGNVIENFIVKFVGNERATERLIERILIAYCWNIEDLETLKRIFKSDQYNQYQNHLFWYLYNLFGEEDIDASISSQIMKFYAEFLPTAGGDNERNLAMLYAFSGLAKYGNNFDQKFSAILLNVSDKLLVTHNFDIVVESLKRVAESNVNIAAQALEIVMKKNRPYYDYENTLGDLLVKLAKGGEREIALRLAAGLTDLPSGRKIYDSILELPIVQVSV